MKHLATRWHQHTAQRHPYRYLITYEVGGRPVRYFTWDAHLIWTWTPTESKASRFTNHDTAKLCADSTSMPDRYRYTIRRVPR